MNFYVQRESLASLAAFFDGYSNTSTNVSDYMTDLDPVARTDVGLLYLILENFFTEYMPDGRQRLAAARDGGFDLSTELDKAVSRYEDMERDAIAKVDSAYPDATPGKPSPTQGKDKENAPLSFIPPPVDPEQALKAPNHQNVKPELNSIVEGVNTWTGYVSATHWLGKALEHIIGFDIFEEISQFLSGDWRVLGDTADGFRNVSKAVGEMEGNVRDSLKKLPECWQGNAADSAYLYINKFASATQIESDYFACAAEYFEHMCDLSFHAYQYVSTGISMLLDVAISAGVGALVSAATGGAAALPSAIVLILRIIGWILDFITQAYLIINSVSGFIALVGIEPAPESKMIKLVYQDGNNSYVTGYELPSK